MVIKMMINGQIQSIAGVYAKNSTMTVKSNGYSAAADQTNGSKDEIVLSSEAKSFSSVLQKMQSSTEDVRTDKISLYTQQIESGSYNVDSGDIAARMIQMRY